MNIANIADKLAKFLQIVVKIFLRLLQGGMPIRMVKTSF